MKSLLQFAVLCFFPFCIAANSPVQESTPRIPSIYVTSMHQWVVERMIAWMPPGKSMIADAKETPEEGKARYESIADDLISVAFDPQEKPVFTGSYGRTKTLAVLLSLAFFESGFRKDVDTGTGPLSKGDSGQSWCLMQVMLGKPERSSGNTKTHIVIDNPHFRFVDSKNEGFGGLDLIRNRKACFRVGLHLVRNSFDNSASFPLYDRLSIYASGKLLRNLSVSKHRIQKAQTWLSQEAPPLKDDEVMDLLHPNVEGERGFPSVQEKIRSTVVSPVG
ncbi:MAG TPA: hypothetical protein VIE65_00245 [Methylobacter sp.]|jgi:hypothetical protein